MKVRLLAVCILMVTAGLPNSVVASTGHSDAPSGASDHAHDLVPAAGALVGARQDGENTYVLKGSSRVWWSGVFTNGRPPVEGQTDPTTALCGVAYECHEYTVRVEGPVKPDSRLRIALTSWSHAFTNDVLTLAVTTPGDHLPGDEECRGASTFGSVHGVRFGGRPYSYEAIMGKGGAEGCDEAVVVGDYTVHVFALGVAADEDLGEEEPSAPYQLRAALDHHEPAIPNRPLVPDLTPDAPPWGFEFKCDPLLDSPSDETKPEGYEGEEERTCLRFFFSWANVGAGLFDLRFDPLSDVGEVPLKQRVYRADATPGVYEEGPAYEQEYQEYDVGTVHFHESHRHWHVSNYYIGQLFPVTDEETIDHERRRDAVKQGLCTTPHFMADFDRIFHDDADVPSTGCDLEFAVPELEEVRMPLPAGWGDYYGTAVPDNFVDVRGMLPHEGGSAEYILRFTLNPDAWTDLPELVESDLENNTAYAYIRIERDADGALHVCSLERGFGDDPWADNAVPVDSTGRTEMCPS